MVFEKPVADLLNRFLGDYIENLDSTQLKIGIWGGDVVLNNLILKQTALADLDLPIQAVFGRLGKLVLKIPWKNLYKEAVEINVEGLYMLVRPNNQVVFDPVKEEKRLQDEKISELQKYEDAKKKAKEPEKKADDTFVEKLAAQIIKNVQLSIKDIHIRYESGDEECSYAAGITMSSLEVQTTDEFWKPTIVEDMVTKVFKIVSLDSLAVYWNCNPKLYFKIPEEELRDVFYENIARKETFPEHYKYILGPINSAARLKLNPKPENDTIPFSVPKAHAELVIENLSIGLTKHQYQDLLNFAENMSLQTCALPYRKYRPILSQYEGHYTDWWLFAYKCILETNIKRRKRDWNWEHMKLHRTRCRRYAEVYKMKLLNKKLTQELTLELEELDKCLDIFNIILVRQSVELEVERMEIIKAKQPKRNWISSWWNKNDDDADEKKSDNILSKFQEAMTPEEKEKLFNAIDYKENMEAILYPTTYVDTVVKFHLKLFEITIKNDDEKRVMGPPVLRSTLTNVKLNVEKFPHKDSLKAAAYVEDLVLYGLETKDNLIPEIISSQTGTETALLDVLFELNPIDSNCGQRLHVTAKPVKIIFDAATIKEVIEVFKVPTNTNLEQLSEATTAKISDIKDVSATGLQHVIDKHTGIDLNLNIAAPYIIIPYEGKFTGGENVLVINLGIISLTSVHRNTSIATVYEMSKKGMDKTDVLDTLITEAYDKFIFKMTNIQVIIAQSDENYMKCIFENDKNTQMQMLKPMDLHVIIKTCIINDNPLLPLIKISGELPILHLNVIDSRLMLLMSVLDSVAGQFGENPGAMVRTASTSSLSMISRHFEMETIKYTPATTILIPKIGEPIVQLTKLQLEFELKDLSLTLHQQETISDPVTEIASFSMECILAKMVMKTYTMTVDVSLRSINMKQLLKEEQHDIIISNKDNIGTENLFNVVFESNDKKSPEFRTIHESIESKLTLTFSKMHIILIEEALVDLINYAGNVQGQIAELQTNKAIQIETIELKSSKKLLNVHSRSEGPKQKKISPNIQFKLMANLNEILVSVESEEKVISNLSVSGMSVEIIMKQDYTNIEAYLRDLRVEDACSNTIHKLICSLPKNENAIYLQITLNNVDILPADCNMEVEAKLGCIRLIFVNRYLNDMLRFLNKFQKAQEAIASASEKAAQTAKQNVAIIQEKATKIRLNIDLKAPEIIIPESSKDTNSILLDLGQINVSNKFNELSVHNEAGDSVVVDDLLIKLDDLRIEKISYINESITGKVPLLEPLSFSINLSRNLSTWYTAIPNIDVIGNIETISLSLGKNDYDTVMNVLTKNLGEGATPSPSRNSVCTQNTEAVNAELAQLTPREETDEVEEERVTTLFRWNFVMKCFKINLYTVDDHDEMRHGLAEFSLEGLSVRGRMLSNNSLSNALLLVNCLWIDTRPDREGSIKCLLSRIKDDDDDLNPNSTIGISKNMIDVTFQQKKEDMFVDIRVYSFTFILCVEYLLNLQNFFSTMSIPQVSEKHKIVANKPIKEEPKKTSSGNLTLTLKVEKPYIMLVEQMDTIDTRALILNSEVLLKFRIFGEKQVMNANIKDLQIYTCIFNPAVRASTQVSVLEPITVNLVGSTPENKGLHIEVYVTDICIRVTLQTIELLSNVSKTLTPTAARDESDLDTLKDRSEMWDMKANHGKEFWFLKSDDVAVEAYHYEFVRMSTVSKKHYEMCILNVPSVILTLEAGIGNKTFPMLLLQSRFEGKVSDWSSQLSVDVTLSVQMGYYNSSLALWEPLVEPVQVEDEKGSKFKPWEIRLEVTMNEISDDVSSPTDPDLEQTIMQAAMSIDISSSTNLELTMTKTGLEVLNNLGAMFATAISDVLPTSEEEAPYKVINASGIDIELLLEMSGFIMADRTQPEVVKLEKNVEVFLDVKEEHSMKLRNLLMEDEAIAEVFLIVDVPFTETRLKLPVIKAETRFFKLNKGNKSWGLVSSVKVDNGITIITLSSIMQIHNTFNTGIDIYYMRDTGNELELISTIQPGGSLYIPMQAVYSQTSELFFSVTNFSVTTTPYIWRDLELNVIVAKNLICCSKENPDDSFVIRAIGEMSQVYFENTLKHTMGSTVYNIYLRPALILKNCLPVDIHLHIPSTNEVKAISPGDNLELPCIEPGKSYIVLRILSYLEKDWSCRHDISLNPTLFSVWTFDSYDGVLKMSLDLGMHTINQNGCYTMSLYCPTWMVNKTGLNISYRSSDENLNIIHHPPFLKGPILFSFNSKNFYGKKKASIRIEQGEWSEKFSIDVSGSSGVIVCKEKNKVHQIGVSNELSYNGLTKIVTLTPYYVIINHSPVTIECQEFGRPADPWVQVACKSCSAFWPCTEQEDKLISLRIGDTEEITPPFMITESHTTLLKVKNRYGGINVDIQLSEGAIYINLALYDDGMAPALIINDTRNTLKLWEKESVQLMHLPPSNNMYYTWSNPASNRILVWEGGNKKEHENELRMDNCGQYQVTDDIIVYWMSFLDGMQRVLLFTSDESITQNIVSSKQIEIIDSEITLSIYGLGLSIVNNIKRQEIMYIGIASTGIIWETCKTNGNRFKQMSTKDNLAMEKAYQNNLLLNEGGSYSTIDEHMDVNFELMLMSRPHKRKLRRRFQTGLWLQIKSSSHQLQIHAKINRLQIDNQLFDCTFPVILAPVPPPKSVSNNAHKPFAELSIVQLLMKNSQIRQFKYFKVLIQEFHIKVDLGIVNALMDIFTSATDNEAEEKKRLLLNIQTVDEDLYALVSVQSIQEQKSFYDVLHFSPLKIHLSFSMSSTGGMGNIPDFLGVILQGIGVTLTDLQDVVFKLAYFEREYTFLTQRQLISEATAHYLGQTVKQFYVLVFGLDVIGNPYGLVLGISQGVEDLFYEPFQGAIQGPTEFAEGLVLGVRSLFGHTVGGAAGAVSKITGAMGKGIAALTFDKEYQRKRREANKRPGTVHEGLARGGKGLVMGVFDGVTGVFTKPISGAKEQGVGGFFKGLGKGAVGLVTRPTAGVMDFASTSFDTVKRVTDFGQEYVNRLRAPRFVQADTYIRPYDEKLAAGNKLLAELEKGKYFSTDIYSCHFIIIDKKEILLLSNKRMAYIVHNDLFGGWQVEWSYTWQEINTAPKIHPKGVQIFVESKKKGMFNNSTEGKIVLIPSEQKCNLVILKIQQHML